MRKRLTDDEVMQMRLDRRDKKMKLEALRIKYGVSLSTVSRILSGERRLDAGGPIQMTPWRRP